MPQKERDGYGWREREGCRWKIERPQRKWRPAIKLFAAGPATTMTALVH